MDYPDIETVLILWLEQTFTALQPTEQRRVDTETPVDMQVVLENDGVFARVGLAGGRDDGVTDRSIVDIEVFAKSRATAYAWSKDIRSRLTGGPHRVGTSAVIDKAVTAEKPRPLPWEDETVRRFGATYRISARR